MKTERAVGRDHPEPSIETVALRTVAAPVEGVVTRPRARLRDDPRLISASGHVPGRTTVADRGRRSLPAVTVIAQSATMLTVVLMFGAVVWGSDRGFDLGDEGFYLLGYQPKQERLSQLGGAFHALVSSVVGERPTSVFSMRVAHLVITLAGSLVFSWGFWAWMRPRVRLPWRPRYRSLAIALPLVGNLVGYAAGPQSLSYNHLNNALLLGVTGLALYVVAPSSEATRRSWLPPVLLVAVGYLVALDFLVKFTTGIGLVGLLTLLFLTRRGGKIASGVDIVIAAPAGVVLALLTYFTEVEPAAVWRSQFAADYSDLARGGSHSGASLLDSYGRSLRDLFGNVVDVLPLLVLVLIATWCYARRANARPVRGPVLWAVLAMALTCSLFFSQPSPYLNHGIERALVPLGCVLLLLGRHRPPTRKIETAVRAYLLGVICLALGVMYFELRQRGLLRGDSISPRPGATYIFLLLIGSSVLVGLSAARRRGPSPTAAQPLFPVGILLLLLPFVGSVGTGNDVLFGVMWHLAPWFALLVVMCLRCEEVGMARSIAGPLLGISMIISLVQLYHGYIEQPYGLGGSLTKQTEPVPRSLGQSRLRVDQRTARSLEQLVALPALQKLQPGTPILALYDMPGVVYLLRGVSPGRVWFESAPRSWATNCRLLSKSKVDRAATLLLVDRPIDPVMSKCLSRSGFPPPEAYDLVGRAPGLYGQVISVYVPKRPA